jgi:hypothetical protein
VGSAREPREGREAGFARQRSGDDDDDDHDDDA